LFSSALVCGILSSSFYDMAFLVVQARHVSGMDNRSYMTGIYAAAGFAVNRGPYGRTYAEA
jgi:hypothetical protein